MESDAIDRLTRTVAGPASRRGLLALAPLLGLGGLGARPDDAEAKKRKKKCGPCNVRKKGKCKGNKLDGKPCADGICRGGKCVPQVCTTDADCPGICECERDVNGVTACVGSASGNCVQECTSNADCSSGYCQASDHCGTGLRTCIHTFCAE